MDQRYRTPTGSGNYSSASSVLQMRRGNGICAQLSAWRPTAGKSLRPMAFVVALLVRTMPIPLCNPCRLLWLPRSDCADISLPPRGGCFACGADRRQQEQQCQAQHGEDAILSRPPALAGAAQRKSKARWDKARLSRRRSLRIQI